MSKKSSIKSEENQRLEQSRRKKNLFCGLLLGLLAGFCFGYCVRKCTSGDAHTRLAEKAFYRERLGEIKNALGQIKAHIHFSGHETDVSYHCDNLENKINAELNN